MPSGGSTTLISGKYLKNEGRVRRPPRTPWTVSVDDKQDLLWQVTSPYLIVAEQSKVDASDYGNSNIELRALQSIELFHGERAFGKGRPSSIKNCLAI